MITGAGYVAGQPGDHTNQTFVTNLYRQLLGREPDPIGQAYWLGILGGNGASSSTRYDVAHGFLSSPEFRQHFITTAYQALLGRAPDPAGLQFFDAMLASGHDLATIIIDLAGSQEYITRNGGTNQSFVNALYRDLLGRVPDAASAPYVNDLNAGGKNHQPDDIVRSLLFSSEGLHKLFDANYQALAGTTPNAAPGAPQTGAYALATITGNGYSNLFFQGNLPSAAIDAAIGQLQKTPSNRVNTTDALATLLAGDQYYG